MKITACRERLEVKNACQVYAYPRTYTNITLRGASVFIYASRFDSFIEVVRDSDTMTGYPKSHLVPLLGSTSSSNTISSSDHELLTDSQLLDCPDNFFFDMVPSSPEVPPKGLVLTSNHYKPNPKVPISRTNTQTSCSSRTRVSQACKACRELKTKCSGYRPACHRCMDLGLDCNYSERKLVLINKYVATEYSQKTPNTNGYHQKDGGLKCTH